MAKLTKKQKANSINPEQLHGVDEAIALAKSNATSKFDETIEVALNLGVDPRHADQMVRGVVNLPKGTGKTVRVGVFARGPKADEAREAGADVVGAEDLRANFDALVDAVVKAKPSGAKGKYVRKVAISSTMGPGIKVDTAEVAGA